MHKQITTIKAISLALLCIILLLLLCYQCPSSSFTLTNITYPFTKFPRLSSITTPLFEQIDTELQQLKLRVKTAREQQYCRKYVKYSTNKSQKVDIQIQQDQQFCGQNGLVYGSALVYVHVLIQQPHYSIISTNLQQLSHKLYTKISNSMYIIPHILDTSILPQHIKHKTDTQLYIKDYAKQLLQMAQFRSCRFTTISDCENLLIVVNNWSVLKQKESYYTVGNQIVFVHHDNYQQTIMQVLHMHHIGNTNNWNRIIKMQVLHRVKTDFQKMINIMEQGYMVIPNLTFLQQYAHKVYQYMQSDANLRVVAPQPLMDKKQAFMIDLMATQYKIGILLPPLLILVLFPCFNICKA